MSEKDLEPDNDGSGMTEGDIHSGPGGYEGMGYVGGYAAEHFGKDDEDDDEKDDEDDDEKDDEDDDFDEDEANRF